MKLYIVRHGETIANRLGICQGQSEWSLSDIGLEQAKKIASRLESEHFDICYSSDLIRAYETAQQIKNKNSFSIIKDVRLRERCFGNMQGQKFSDNNKDLNIDMVYGAESMYDMELRIRAFIDELLSEKRNFEKVLVVTHGVTIKVMLSILQNSVFSCDKDMLSIQNVSLTICDISHGKTTIELFNDTLHLQ